jgi:hypothetical protein
VGATPRKVCACGKEHAAEIGRGAQCRDCYLAYQAAYYRQRKGRRGGHRERGIQGVSVTRRSTALVVVSTLIERGFRPASNFKRCLAFREFRVYVARSRYYCEWRDRETPANSP